ncbi:hypothetical protein [Aeoliella mucimassa]|uniref:PEP-CTERM protein-sorting domain-containing protein n=1 Tax=Aeoliella mucimassa TaxID=2527972 RepID=A0A518ANV5_9BACT|nr:hypothetical protein [Aeoliella mucimassa]QDU56402.1 hypothetical protein Pan181_26110 [Aeoliella mucimassa]
MDFRKDVLVIGQSGSGALQIVAGGEVRADYSLLGKYYGSSGTATVTGAGSKWVLTKNDTVGNDNTGLLRLGYNATLHISNQGLVAPEGGLSIGTYNSEEAYVSITTGGQLALFGEADDSIDEFLDLVAGTDAIRYWSTELNDWAHITEATYGDDYTLEYLTSGGLAGYTVLTVGTPTTPGDFNGDGLVNLADYTVWRDHFGATDESSIGFAGDGLAGVDLADYDLWKANFAAGDSGNIPPALVPEPSAMLLSLAALLGWGGLARRV